MAGRRLPTRIVVILSMLKPMAMMSRPPTEVICARLEEKRSVDELMQTWLTDFQIQILTMRYVNNHDWDYIALKIPCDESTARKQEQKAVKKLMYRINIS